MYRLYFSVNIVWMFYLSKTLTPLGLINSHNGVAMASKLYHRQLLVVTKI